MNTTSRIPFLDLVAPHEELKEELCSVFATALKTGGFIGGPMVEGFEQDFAGFCDSRYCIGVGSGTDALRFALIAAEIQRNDIVITVPNTFIATTEAISQAGARPAFVDVDERTYNMDPKRLQDYLERDCKLDERGRTIDRTTGDRVAAIVPVHLYGQMCDMDAILELAGLYNLTVIEDACQAHGAKYFSTKENRWRKAGSMGKAAAFSFYPGKNLGACGEAGAVITDDGDLAQRVRMLRDHGQTRKYYHDIEGYNGRLDAIQAGILQVKLRRLADWNGLRRDRASRYEALLAPAAEYIGLPYEPSWTKAIYHLYAVRVQNRDQIQGQLSEANIGTGIHYPVPLHLQTAYSDLGYAKGDFPVAERAATELLSLPMYPGLQQQQQDYIATKLLDFVSDQAPMALQSCITA